MGLGWGLPLIAIGFSCGASTPNNICWMMTIGIVSESEKKSSASSMTILVGIFVISSTLTCTTKHALELLTRSQTNSLPKLRTTLPISFIHLRSNGKHTKRSQTSLFRVNLRRLQMARACNCALLGALAL